SRGSPRSRHRSQTSIPKLSSGAYSLDKLVSRVRLFHHANFRSALPEKFDFSVQPLCSLCLCGCFTKTLTTEAQRTKRLHREEACPPSSCSIEHRPRQDRQTRPLR